MPRKQKGNLPTEVLKDILRSSLEAIKEMQPIVVFFIVFLLLPTETSLDKFVMTCFGLVITFAIFASVFEVGDE